MDNRYRECGGDNVIRNLYRKLQRKATIRKLRKLAEKHQFTEKELEALIRLVP